MPARTRYLAVPCIVLGAIAFGLGALSYVLSRNLFDPVIFGRRVADSLSDPGVSAWAADHLTNEIIRAKPDLIAFRPMLDSAEQAILSSRMFRPVVERAAQEAHHVAFSEGSRRVLLSLPDLNVLVHEAVQNASPALAAKIPKSLDATIARVTEGSTAGVLLDAARIGRQLGRTWPVLFVLAIALYAAAIWLAADRRLAAMHAGIGLIVAGLVLASIVGANPLAALWIDDPKTLGFARGVWRVFLGDLVRWGLLFAGLGVLTAAGAASLLDRIPPLEALARFVRKAAAPPKTHPRRFGWGLAVFAFGCIAAAFPILALTFVGTLAGVAIAYAGLRELFSVFVEKVENVQQRSTAETGRRAWPIAVAGTALGLVAAVACGAWLLWRHPAAAEPRRAPVAITACNGYSELCDRRVDQVVFAGAHNAMSNQDAPGWMFPQHEAGMPQMLRDGVRALLIDVHYGFPGGVRIKTDMRTEPSEAVMKKAIGAQGYAAAMRIRDRLVGVDESKHALYFCHGFCELGAYPVAPALREIRDFMVAHPDEVIILVVEDYVSPRDLAGEFEKSGLAALVYKDAPSPEWPTLRQLIERDTRVLAFIESGKPGVPWLRPAFQTFQETPYTFHKPDEFSCKPNRGGTTGRLFQMNHWIDSTPAPKPSNAAIVNAYPFLLARAEKCQAERGHLPNLIAVDFYKTGDLLAVVNKLNGVGNSISRLN